MPDPGRRLARAGAGATVIAAPRGPTHRSDKLNHRIVDADTFLHHAMPDVVGGIGLLFSVHEDGIIVHGVARGLPADAAGLSPGMVIVSIDGTALRGVPEARILALLRGTPGSCVELEVTGPGTRLAVVQLPRVAIDVAHVADLEWEPRLCIPRRPPE